MSTLLAESPAAAAEAPRDGTPDGPPPGGQPNGVATVAPAGVPCAKCGAALAPGQDWCLQCGAGAPGGASASGWRPLATIALATLLLALGATAAGYAALSAKPRHAAVRTATVAAAPAPAPATPGLTAPGVGAPTAPGPAITKPPRIPLKASTPTPTATTPAPATRTPEETNSGSKSKSTTETGGASTEPTAILLDTNAAQTYNPYNYPATEFGDPSLAIDGDGSTGWTARINPATAPKLAEGVLIDLKTPHKLSALKLITTTPGMGVQVYGSSATTVPSSITDHAWVHLSPSLTIHKRHARLTLRSPKRGFRFVVLWISRAPASSVGTAAAPGRVTVNELELFPAP